MEFYKIYYTCWSLVGEVDFDCMAFNWMLSDMSDELIEMRNATMLEF